MSLCLAIETSSRVGSVALQVDERIVEREIATPRAQTAVVLALVDQLLTEVGAKVDDLEALVFGRGPGSFTGLRVAAAVVQGLGFATGVPIVGVSSLQALAQRRLEERSFELALCCIDARMGEVYVGSYRADAGLVAAESAEMLVPPAQVRQPAGAFVALGDGFDSFATELGGVIAGANAIDTTITARGRELLALGAADIEAGRFLSPDEALPVYLRDASAWQRA